HQRLVGFDNLALLDQEFADDAAFEVLDLLVLADGDEIARRHHRARKRRDRRPGAEAREPEEQHRKSDHGRNSRAARHAAIPRLHARTSWNHDALSLASAGSAVDRDFSADALSGIGSADGAAGSDFCGGRTSRSSTSLGGPNASSRPARRIKSLSML